MLSLLVPEPCSPRHNLDNEIISALYNEVYAIRQKETRLVWNDICVKLGGWVKACDDNQDGNWMNAKKFLELQRTSPSRVYGESPGEARHTSIDGESETMQNPSWEASPRQRNCVRK